MLSSASKWLAGGARPERIESNDDHCRARSGIAVKAATGAKRTIDLMSNGVRVLDLALSSMTPFGGS